MSFAEKKNKTVQFAPADSVVSGAHLTETLAQSEVGDTAANVFEGLVEEPIEAPLLNLKIES